MIEDRPATAEPEPESETPVGRPRPVARVVGLASVLHVLAAGLLLLIGGANSSMRPGATVIVVIVALGFGLAERFAFHVEYRRDAISFSMSEVPTALALLFLGPLAAVVIRVCCSLSFIWLTTRPPLYKLYFNSGLFAFEMAVAFGIVRHFVDVDGSNGDLLLACAFALAVSTLVGSVIVSIAISQFEGGFVTRLAQEMRVSMLTTPIITTFATAAVAPALFRPELALFPLAPIAAAWFAMLRFGQLAQNYRDLEALHGFAGTVGRPVYVDDVTNIAIEEACRLLRAGSGFLQAYGADGRAVATSVHDMASDHTPTGSGDPRWKDVFALDGAAMISADGSGTMRVGAAGRHGLIAVPIRDETGLIGLLVVAHRTGASDVFDTAEISRADTLAAQLGSTLRRALLHSYMEHAALHDDLTGEFNRPAFELALKSAGRDIADRDGYSAVMMLDLDRFKEVNDTMGHHVGDRVLVEFTARVKTSLAQDDVLARFGGDEFAILVQRPDLESVRALAEEIRSTSFTPMVLDELDIVVTASIGIARLTAENFEQDEVLRQADVAMYTAKRDHTRVEVYHNDIDHRTPERLALLSGLRDVLDRGGLEVHYQPKVDLITSTVTGVEALVRWNHPSRGWIPPCDFVRVAEESGLIKQLTDYVLIEAIGTASIWNRLGYDLEVAVNLSAHDLLDEGLPQRVANLMASQSVPADRLTLEITESAVLADTPRTMGTIDRLDRLGVRLSLDDFGTGYSSLGYLRRLPVAELKVDQSFVKNVLLDEQDAAIVRSTIDLGHNLGLQVVAEGIENMPVLEHLRMLGCDIGQGFGISRPLPKKLLDTWLATTHYSVPRRDSLLAT